MPRSCIFIVLIICVLPRTSYSQNVSAYQRVTVVRVHEYSLPSTYIEDTGIGAPELPEVYNYDIAIQVACNVYTGRYRSDSENLQSVLGLHREIEARIKKRLLFVKTDRDREIEMRIVGHRQTKGNGCQTKG